MQSKLLIRGGICPAKVGWLTGAASNAEILSSGNPSRSIEVVYHQNGTPSRKIKGNVNSINSRRDLEGLIRAVMSSGAGLVGPLVRFETVPRLKSDSAGWCIGFVRDIARKCQVARCQKCETRLCLAYLLILALYIIPHHRSIFQ